VPLPVAPGPFHPGLEAGSVAVQLVEPHPLRIRRMVPLDREEFGRPFSQARHTLDSARRDAEEGDYDWAAFKAQQAAESILAWVEGFYAL
jgi:hypothetical protein